MREESGRVKTIFISHVIDDGWHLPQEVIEEIVYRIEISKDEAMRKVLKLNKNHTGDWLTREIAESYAAKSWVYRVITDNQYIGMVRELGEELQKLYGVTELEAINILNNYHIADYVNKYYRIKNMIPDFVDEEKIVDEVISSFGLAV